MPDISSNVRIGDEFSEPLRELAEFSRDAEEAMRALAEAILDQNKISEELADKTKEISDEISKNAVPGFDDFCESISNVNNSLNDLLNNFDGIESIKNIGESLKDAAKSGFDLAKSMKGSKLEILKMMNENPEAVAKFTSKVAMGAFNTLKRTYITIFSKVKDSIEKSLDDIELSDKLEAMYGDAGKVAKRRAYELANQIGESAKMVTELSAKAAYEGIGTDQFERMMKLADKVAKLKPGETTEGVANTLMQSLKSGHDASSIAQLYGGGEVMERQLRRAGYERALNRGDIDKALEIAEKIAEQSGLTDENYKNAYQNMSSNFKRILNVIDNVKSKLMETFNRSFAPAVEKVKDFVTSDKFQNVVSVLERIIGLVGDIANWIVEGLIDNIEIFGVLLAVAGVANLVLIAGKVSSIVKESKLLLKIVGLFKGPIVAIVSGLQKVIAHLVSIGLKQTLILIKTKALQALKVAGPWLLVGAAIAGALKFLHYLFGEGKTFTEFLMGSLGAVLKLGMNLFTNFFILMEKLGDKVRILFLKIRSAMLSAKQLIMSKIGEIITWLLDKLKDSPIGWIFDQLGVDISGAVAKDKEWAATLGSEEADKLAEIAQEIKGIEGKQLEYISVMDGVKEAFDSNGKTVIEIFKGLFKSSKNQEEEQKGISGDTGKIRKLNEREEELAWLKAFSDRQIVSSISQMTSNTQNINQYGTSDTTQKETMRRIVGRPGRYATLH